MKIKNHNYVLRILCCIIIILFMLLLHKPAAAFSAAEAAVNTANDAAAKLIQFCLDPKAGFDERAVASLVDYVLSSKPETEHPLPKSHDCAGAYYEFDTKITFPRFMEYSYSSLVPSPVTRPSSLRYSIWTGPRGEPQKLPASWKTVSPADPPVVIRGMQHDSNTPDLTTGVYNEYDLKRTLILVNHRGRQALISISKQASESSVGKKGVILGQDNDWNYFYSGEPGTAKTGLGWVKSYIYDYFSVGVYVESGVGSNVVRSGLFQWLRAGWAGINFVKPNHILDGMKRFASNSRTVLESSRLPAPDRMISVYQWLSNMPASDLTKKYVALQQALRSAAVQLGKISKSQSEAQDSSSNISKEQMVDELMLEYVKMTIGKPTLIAKEFSVLPTGLLPSTGTRVGN